MIRLKIAALTLGVIVAIATTAGAQAQGECWWLVVTSKRRGVVSIAARTIPDKQRSLLAANGNLGRRVSTLGTGTIDTQSAIRSEIPADEGIQSPLPAALIRRRNVRTAIGFATWSFSRSCRYRHRRRRLLPSASAHFGPAGATRTRVAKNAGDIGRARR